MANTTIQIEGIHIPVNFIYFWDTYIQQSTKPTERISSHKTFKGSIDLLGRIPENATIVSVRCDSGGFFSMSENMSYQEGGFSNLLNPDGSVFGNINSTDFLRYINQYGISTVYYRVGVRFTCWNWEDIGGTPKTWSLSGTGEYEFMPWFEITYKFAGVEHKIKFATFSPTTGNGSWQRASTYAPVETPDGVKWYECEVRYCINPSIWVDIPNATAEEQPRTDRYEAVGADVPNKILNGYCGNNDTTWNRVRGSDTRRTLTYHDAPPGTYKIRFSCAYSFRLYRANYDSTWHDLQMSYQAGTYDYEITTTTTGFVGFMFIFNSTSEAQTFEMAKLGESGEPTWVLCGEEA